MSNTPNEFLTVEEIGNLRRFKLAYMSDVECKELSLYRRLEIYRKAVQAGFYNEGL